MPYLLGLQDTSDEDEVNACLEVTGTRLGVNRVLENSDMTMEDLLMSRGRQKREKVRQ